MDERMTTKRTNSGPSDSQLLAMYERMLLVRRMEERLRDDNAAENCQARSISISARKHAASAYAPISTRPIGSPARIAGTATFLPKAATRKR